MLVNMYDCIQKHVYSIKGEGMTTFLKDSGKIELSGLFGMTCGLDGKDSGSLQTKGLANIVTEKGCSEMLGLSLKKVLLAMIPSKCYGNCPAQESKLRAGGLFA